MEYSIAIYRNGSLIDSYITESIDESQIDEYFTGVQNLHPDCEVYCIEYEEYDGQDD